MLENSYDASSIKFGILVSSKLPYYSEDLVTGDLDIKTRVFKRLLENKDTHFIDFKEFDGLTIEEVSKVGEVVQAQKTIIFISYRGFDIHSGTNVIDRYIAEINPVFIEINDKTLDVPIDKLIECYYLDSYNNHDETHKKRARCFLQRYRYGTKERTDEKIKEYTK